MTLSLFKINFANIILYQNAVVLNLKHVKIRLFRVSTDNGNNVFITFVLLVFVSTEHVKRGECAARLDEQQSSATVTGLRGLLYF